MELVNQELNFSSLDENLVIRGGCDLFTTKPIGSDRKLFKTIDKHLDQILEDNQLSQSMDQERKQSMSSLLGSSASPLTTNQQMMGLARKESSASLEFSDVEVNDTVTSLRNLANSQQMEPTFYDESPFGSLKDASSRKVFAYLIAILNTTFSDHDFSNLQPTTENFNKIDLIDDLRHQFNNVMMSLGKKEDTLAWIWDTLNVYMEIHQSNASTGESAPNVRRKSSSTSAVALSDVLDNDYGLKVYEFQPSDQSILEDLNYPYQTMWSNYWFIYNKKKKRVCFLYLTAINKLHFSQMNRSRSPFELESKDVLETRKLSQGLSDDEIMTEGNGDEDEDEEYESMNRDIIGGLEI